MKTIDLASSSEWLLENVSSHKEIHNVQMNIPGDIHSALIRAKKIPDPYWAFNEKDVQWVGRENWKIRRTFHFKKQAGFRHYLCISMADTFFCVFLNGKKVSSGNNFFRLWRFDITDFLKDGKNSIEILFESAEKEAARIAKTLPYPVPYSEYDMVSPHRNLVRKIQCQAGWDWGPCLMVSGIYGDLFIDSVRQGFITSVCVQTEPCKKNGWYGDWNVQVTIRYESFCAGTKTFLLELDGLETSEAKSINTSVKEGLNEISAHITVSHPALWKTSDELKDAGLAENELYTLVVKSIALPDERHLQEANAAQQFPSEDSVMQKHIAFRTLRLNATEDKHGTALYYELNGRRIFAKGANWVPVDALPERWTKERYDYFLRATVDANMNSLRFWGGGMYESELCYTLCDKLGIIVWQDCAFGCSLYPATDDFLKNVEKEIEDNVYRLQSHPSLAVWCGNNENFGALNWYKESRQNRDRYLVDYDRLNHDTVEKTVRRCDPSRLFWPSSPCAGLNTFGDNWHNDSEGDMHFWSVWHEKKDMEAYLSIKPRFVSEFGYESFPSLEGVKEFAPEEETNLTSPVMEWHQRSPGGNSIMLENFSRYFRFPSGTENMLYLSQVQQAVAVKTAVDYWRSLRPHCMGATYWQLNDVWPVASWSSLEYSGKWKLLHYAAKNFFNRVHISLIKKDETVFANVINETQNQLAAKIKIRIVDFAGSDLCAPIETETTLAKDSTKIVWQTTKEKLCSTLSVLPNECFVYAELFARAGTQDFCAQDTLFLERWKKCTLPAAEIKADITQQKDGVTYIRLSTDKPAFFVSADFCNVKGIFSNNMFTLLPESPVTLSFVPNTYGLCQHQKKYSLAELKKSLCIMHLQKTYE